jgi:tRNA pseudouridine38-40 synthase
LRPARRLALGIEYDGSAYSGWQIQPQAPSIQRALERALGQIADKTVSLVCAGRTDAGVHALAQVAHFDTDVVRRGRAWLLGANTHLPRDISVQWIHPVPDHFHARYSALARSYRYLILNHTARSALAANRGLLVHQRLEIDPMRVAAESLLGEHDFTAFRSIECQARSPVRVLHRLGIERVGDWIIIELTANAFLQHMARNIVGLLLSVGLGRAAPTIARQVLEARARDAHTMTAPACGLYLWRVDYPPQFGLPDDSAMISAPIPGWPAVG